MFTRTYYKMLAQRIAWKGQGMKTKSWQNTDLTIESSAWPFFGDPSDSSVNPTPQKIRTSTTSYGGVVLGTGTVAPTLDDYKLSGDLITTVTASCSFTMTPDENGITFKSLFTITNTGDSDITIGEIGLICNPYNSSSAEVYKALLERTVLDSPVAIEAGGVGQVTYTIRMDFPS